MSRGSMVGIATICNGFGRRLCCLVLLMFSVAVNAADGEGAWKWSGGGQTNLPTKGQAVSAMQSSINYGHLLTIEKKVSSSYSSISLSYSAPKANPQIGNWTYTAGGLSGGYSSESEALTALTANRAQYDDPQCQPTTLSANGGWTGTQYTMGTARYEYKYYNRTSYYYAPAQGACVSVTYEGNATIYRSRSVACAAPYNTNDGSKCIWTTTGSVTGSMTPPPCDRGCTCKGNPCDASSGSKVQPELDYQGVYLSFKRTYISFGFLENSELATGWWHEFDSVVLMMSGSPSGIVRGGRIDGITQISTGYYRLSHGTGELRKDASNNWILDDGQIKEVYNSSGRLISRELMPGLALTFTYDASGRLATVADPAGRTLTLEYGSNGRLSLLRAPGGDETTYSYDAAGNLVGVQRPDSTTRQYHYENATWPNALTGITDEAGVRFGTYSYDSIGRAISTEHTGGAERYDFVYNTDNTVVTDALGAQTTYKFKTVYGVRALFTQSEPCPTCAGGVGVTTYAHDFYGNVTQKTDPRGVITKYIHNATRRLETSRTEAFGTPQARTIATTWHATLRKPLTITEPGKVTTYTYDASGNMLTKTVTDTATSATQTWTWTYNAQGRVLTEDGPRTDVSDVVAYVYYNNTSPYHGLLASITNAVGHVTQYTGYNVHGQPLTIVDPNGVVTTLGYDSRQRMTSHVRNGKTTSFAYNPVNKLTQVTLPDGNEIDYVYDDARRLAEIHDKAGNRIVYTYDAMSRRTKEELKDTQGMFSSWLKWIEQSLAVSTVKSRSSTDLVD